VRLTRIAAQNFLTFGEKRVVFDPRADRNTLVGPNGAGKTSLFVAIDFLDYAFAQPPPEVEPFRHRGAQDAEPDLEVRVILSPTEVHAVTDWMLIAGWSEQLNTPDGTTELGESPDLGAARELSQELVGYTRPVFEALFEKEVTFRAKGTGNPAHPLDAWIEIRIGKDTLYLTEQNELRLGSAPRYGGGFQVELRKETLKRLRRWAPKALLRDASKRSIPRTAISRTARSFNLKWYLDALRASETGSRFHQVHPIEIANYENQLRSEPSSAKNLVSFLRARGYKPGTIGLRGLLRLILETSIVRLSNYRSPPDSAPSAKFHEIPTRLPEVSGFELPAALWKLKDSPDSSDRARYDRIRGALRRFTVQHVDVEVVLETEEDPPKVGRSNPATEWPNPRPARPTEAAEPSFYQYPRLRFKEDGHEFGAEFASAGLYESLVLIFTALANEGTVVVLDEPATNLHPVLQRAFAQFLTKELRKSGVQLFVVTHSPAFVDPQNLRGVTRVDRPDGSTRIKPLSTEMGPAFDQFARDARKVPGLIPMLFAKKVVLFEGQQEARSLPPWFRKLDPTFDLAELGIDAADAGGDSNLEKCARALKTLDIPFAIVGDQSGKGKLARLSSNLLLVPYDDFGEVARRECKRYLLKVHPRLPWPSHIDADDCREVALISPPPRSVKRLWKQVRTFVDDST